MRCIPIGLFASGKRRQNESIAISEFIHNDLICTVSCAAYNEIFAALVNGNMPQEAVWIGKTVADDLDCAKVIDPFKEGETLPLAKIASEGLRG
jgi:ADP-ribosylglycohydrolase